MKNYKWILFDADETLFRFDAFSGLQLMFSRFGTPFTKQDYKKFQVINSALWLDYQNKRISAQELQERRFAVWSDKLRIPACDLSHTFQTAMAEISTLLEGAYSLLNTLKGKCKLGIITNGFTALQDARLAKTGLKDHFDILVISEQVGITKPDRGIFDHALALMGNPAREHVLMVGDNPSTDIQGGINAGFHTCWLNVARTPAPKGITPQYQVASLMELECLFQNNFPIIEK